MTVEGLGYRETVIRIAESESLQDFLRIHKKVLMNHTFLNKCLKVIRPETWKRVNEALSSRLSVVGCHRERFSRC